MIARLGRGWGFTSEQIRRLDMSREWRSRFAWRPVRLHTLEGNYTVPLDKLVWLAPVCERRGFAGRWVAWEDDQPGRMVKDDTGVVVGIRK